MATAFKVGDVIQNYHGRYAKIIELRGSRYGISAWVLKQSDAEAETRVVRYLNPFGLSQVIGDQEAKAKAKKPAPKKEAKAKAE